jgi:hypothetical protein
MAHVCVAPDLVGPLGANQLERDGAHRCDGSKLDEALSLGVRQLRRDTGDGIEPRDEQARGSVRSDVLGHEVIFAAVPDGPA